MFIELGYSEHPIHNEIGLAKQYRMIREQRGSVHERSLSVISELFLNRNPSQIIVESTPLYAIPSEDYPDQALNSTSALSAVAMTEDIMEIARALDIPIQHWVLLDDVHNGSNSYTSEQIWHGFIHGVSGELPIYGQVTRKQFESDFRKNDESTCAQMDAGFQMMKICEATRDFTDLGRLPLFVNVHPNGFRNQQRSMLERLKNLVKIDRNAHAMQVSKAVKNSLVLDTYLHVWTNGVDSVEVTRPVMANGSIIHSPITT